MTYNREELIAELKRDEGEVLTAYQDSRGFWTIGVGHCIDRCVAGAGISASVSAQLLEQDIARAALDLDYHLPWWRDLGDARQRVLLNMAINLGDRLLGFRKALAAMRAGDWTTAAAEMLDSQWAIQVGARAQRLAEAMKTGAMPAT
jgi:lysozyme